MTFSAFSESFSSLFAFSKYFASSPSSLSLEVIFSLRTLLAAFNNEICFFNLGDFIKWIINVFSDFLSAPIAAE
ncbi:MAG: hypothetical protein ABIH00_10075 [Armatimonadota bacterium]